MTIRFVTIVTQDFWPGLAALVQSISENSGLATNEYEFQIICPLDQAPRAWLDSRPETISLLASSAIPSIPILSPLAQGKRMEESLQKLGVFALPEDGKTRVLIDCDMVCLGSLRELLDARPISGTSDHLCGFDTGKTPDVMDNVIFNGGLIVFTPSMKAFNELLSVYANRHGDGLYCADQDVLNIWLQETGQSMHWLGGSEWNFAKRFQDFAGRRWAKERIGQVKLLHFVGVKPWTDNADVKTFRECRYRWMEEIWWDYFERSGFAAHMQHPPRRSIAFIRQWILPWTSLPILREHCIRGCGLLRRLVKRQPQPGQLQA